MTAERPIVVLMTSRTGSSMVAGLFAHHGLWVGDKYVTGSGLGKDYPSYETREVKSWLRERYDLQGAELVTNTQAGQFADFIAGIVPPGRRWLVKCGVMFWPLFEPLNPHIVYVRRDFENSVAAIMARPGAAAEAVVRDLIARRYALMDQIHAEHGGTMIDTDKLIAGDYGDIRAAFDECGLEFVEEIAKTVIQPDRWHFHKNG